MWEGEIRGRRVYRFRAKIIRSVKHGIPKTVQQTWRVFADHHSDQSALKVLFVSNARRWQHKMMLQWFGSPEKFPKQMEINECNETSNQVQPVPGVQEAGLVPDRKVTGAVYEGGVGENQNPE